MEETSIPPHLIDVYNVLACAFPESIKEEEYIPLINILYQWMSFRAIATVLAKVSQRSYIEIYNDASGHQTFPVDPEQVEKVLNKLLDCKYGELKKESHGASAANEIHLKGEGCDSYHIFMPFTVFQKC